MKLFFFALVLWFCCDISYGVVFDPYTRRYNIRNASFDALFSPSPTASTSIQAIVLASTKIDNDRCKAIHQYAVRPTLDQLVSFQYELIDLCPQLYETIRSKNITTWGPIDEFLQIWYMKFVDALWRRISLKQASGRCALYDDFIAAAENDLDTALMEYLENNYNPSLCEVNEQTMREWHIFFQRTQVFNRITKHLKIGSFSISLVHAIAKAYLTEARYNSYLSGPPFPLITYMNASLTMPALNFTLTQKSFIKQTYTILNTNFGTLDLAGRINYFLMKFSESIDSSWMTWQMFTSIPLDPLDAITYYHLLLYYSRKEFLLSKQLQYVAPPTTTTTTTPTPPLTCPSIPPPTTTPTCTAPPGTAEIFLGSGVVLELAQGIMGNLGKVDPVGTCNNSLNGYTAYYAGNTSGRWDEFEPVTAGIWRLSTCSLPCACTTTACYEPYPGWKQGEPAYGIFLYPHCVSVNECFIGGVLHMNDYFFNTLNPNDKYEAVNQETEGIDYKPITDVAYLRITKLGCNGCPVIKTPSTCSCPPTIPLTCTAPSGTAAIYIENGVTLDDDVASKTEPVATCNYGNGIMAYYNGSNPKNYYTPVLNVKYAWVGNWVRVLKPSEQEVCSSPCICTAKTCYNVIPGYNEGPFAPTIWLYPHCITPNNCFVAAVVSLGKIVNPSNATDFYNSDVYEDDVTLPIFPKITKIGCSGCAALM